MDRGNERAVILLLIGMGGPVAEALKAYLQEERALVEISLDSSRLPALIEGIHARFPQLTLLALRPGSECSLDIPLSSWIKGEVAGTGGNGGSRARDRGHGQRAGDGRGSPLLDPPCRLTPQERVILQLLAQGATNKEVAASLYITVNTVRTHVRRLMSKLGASNRTHRVMKALGRGDLSAGS